MNNEGRIVAACGLLCNECQAYLATVNDSDEMRKKTAEQWSKMFNAEIKWQDINCLGCLQDEKLFGHCNVCEIRSCARGKGLENCSGCADFGCKKVNEIWKHVGSARTLLEEMRG